MFLTWSNSSPLPKYSTESSQLPQLEDVPPRFFAGEHCADRCLRLAVGLGFWRHWWDPGAPSRRGAPGTCNRVAACRPDVYDRVQFCMLSLLGALPFCCFAFLSPAVSVPAPASLGNSVPPTPTSHSSLASIFSQVGVVQIDVQWDWIDDELFGDTDTSQHVAAGYAGQIYWAWPPAPDQPDLRGHPRIS